MPIVAVFQSPSFTQEQYEETVKRLTGKDRMESQSDWPVGGLLAHIAGQGANGFRVVDVWESEESFNSFGQTLLPILEDLGIDTKPEVYPAHTIVSG